LLEQSPEEDSKKDFVMIQLIRIGVSFSRD
jgi:hypothetical protein